MNKTIIIPGNPVAAHRPRFSRRSGRAYDGQKQARDCMTWHVVAGWGDIEPIDGPVEVDVTFHMTIPKSASKKRRLALQGQPCLKHVDTDNLQKILYDSMLGVCFNDDSQIWAVNARKVWDEDGRTVVIVR